MGQHINVLATQVHTDYYGANFCRQSSLSVEEDSVSLTLVVERSFPSFGTITVVVATVNDTATDDEDFDPM